MRVLLIEDDYITAEALLIFFQSEHIDAKATDNIGGAIEMIHTWVPDVIVSDINVRGVNAFFLLDYVEKYNQKIPVIAVSGEAVDEISKSRFIRFLSKPTFPEEILAVIRSVVNAEP